MSWDVSILKLSRSYRDASEIPDDEKPIELGSLADIHRAVLSVFPGTDWQDPSWGLWSSHLGSIEFNVGKDDPVLSFMLHVRASEGVVSGIVQLCLDNSWQGIDCSSGEFIERAQHPELGLSAWSAYRDQIVGRASGGA